MLNGWFGLYDWFLSFSRWNCQTLPSHESNDLDLILARLVDLLWFDLFDGF